MEKHSLDRQQLIVWFFLQIVYIYVGSQAVSIGVDVVKIGTMIITDIVFFANRTRKIIFDYDNEKKINCTEDLILLGELHKKNDWRGIARLHNKYVSLLKKRRN